MSIRLLWVATLVLATSCGGPPAPRAAARAPSSPAAPAAPAAPTTAPAPPATSFTAPRFQRTNVGPKLSAYLPPGYPQLEVSESPDGSTVYTGELAVGGYTYACIGVDFKDALQGPPQQAEEILVAYLDYLKGQFGITQAAGYGHGHTLPTEPTARGVLDYWATKDGTHYSVEGWVTNAHLIVMIIYGATDYPSPTAAHMFLEGARFAPAP